MALGFEEIGLICLAGVLLFGAPKVIDWARALGKAKKAYKEEVGKE